VPPFSRSTAANVRFRRASHNAAARKQLLKLLKMATITGPNRFKEFLKGFLVRPLD
jgi:hypothetical protein